MSNDAALPRVDAVVLSRDAEVVNDAAADVGRPLPDASTEGGYCPEHLYVNDGDDYHGFSCYFGFEGAETTICDVAYPGASPCFSCMIERCCLPTACAGGEIDERFDAPDGERIFSAWSSFAMVIDRQGGFRLNGSAPFT